MIISIRKVKSDCAIYILTFLVYFAGIRARCADNSTDTPILSLKI